MQNRDDEDEETTLLTEHSDRSCDEDVIIEGGCGQCYHSNTCSTL